MKKSNLFVLAFLLMAFASGCAPTPTPVPPTFTPSPIPPTFTPSLTLTPTQTPTPTVPSISSDEVLIQIVSATWSEKYNDQTAKSSYKYLTVTIRLEFLGGKAGVSPSFSVKNDHDIVFALDTTEFDVTNLSVEKIRWITGIFAVKPEPMQFAKGETIDPLKIIFTGPDDSGKFIFSFGDLPPIDITEFVKVE